MRNGAYGGGDGRYYVVGNVGYVGNDNNTAGNKQIPEEASQFTTKARHNPQRLRATRFVIDTIENSSLVVRIELPPRSDSPNEGVTDRGVNVITIDLSNNSIDTIRTT